MVGLNRGQKSGRVKAELDTEPNYPVKSFVYLLCHELSITQDYNFLELML